MLRWLCIAAWGRLAGVSLLGLLPFRAMAQVVAADTLCTSQPHLGEILSATDSAFTPFADTLKAKRHPWRAAGYTLLINGGIYAVDHWLLEKNYAQTTWKTIKENLSRGLAWDYDGLATNFFYHPYHGNLYFTAARASGMSFWASSLYALGGSMTWEAFCENEPPAWNDLASTTFGGIALGEVAHRLSERILDPRARGVRRVWRELAAAVVSPMRGFDRLLTGKAWHVAARDAEGARFCSEPLHLWVDIGDRYLAAPDEDLHGVHLPHVGIGLTYGNFYVAQPDRSPYTYFDTQISLSFGKKQPTVDRLDLVGRIAAVPVRDKGRWNVTFGCYQHLLYALCNAVSDGLNNPYKFSEAAALGPGIGCRLVDKANRTVLDCRLYADAILMGGILTDHVRMGERDYSFGSGYALKGALGWHPVPWASLGARADFFHLFTWDGYPPQQPGAEPIPIIDSPQGDKGNSRFLMLSASASARLSTRFGLAIEAVRLGRVTHYADYPTVSTATYDVRMSARLYF